MHGVLYLGECSTNKCNVYFAECPDLKPLTGRSRSTRRKAGDSSPEHRQSSHDTEASRRAKRESYAYIYYILFMHGVLYFIKCFSKCNMHFTECPDLKPLTGRSRSTRRKAGDSSPEHREASHDTEASGRTGSKRHES